MAKDPAILWYWNDWNGGTSTFTRHLKGCYIDLLSSQFNSGRLSLAEIKTVLGADFGPSWPALQKKFRKDENDLYYNERMEQEQEKRKRFTESRRRNLDSKQKKPLVGDHMVNGTGSLMDNEIENENRNRVVERGMGKEEGSIELPPDGFLGKNLDKSIVLTDEEITESITYLKIKVKKVFDRREIVEQWEAFKIKVSGTTKWYNGRKELTNHFIDSLKVENNGNRNSTAGKNYPHKPVITGEAEGAGSL